MAIDLTGISNCNDFYTDHYITAILENDLKDLFKQWTDDHKERGIRPPHDLVDALSKEYFKLRDGLAKAKTNEEILEGQRAFFGKLFQALGYELQPLGHSLDGDDGVLPLAGAVSKESGAPALWFIETACHPEDEIDPLDLRLDPCQSSDPQLQPLPEHDTLEELVSKRIYSLTEPPRWLILYNLGNIVLLDRSKWNAKRLLRFELEEIFGRRETTTIKAMAAFLHKDSICPGDGVCLLDTLSENSHKHAYSVSEDLKYAVREAVELLGNEAVYFHGKYDVIDPDQLTHESLRYLYRLLFLFYIEARPELGYAPLKSDEYRLGYSLESLRELEMVPLNTDEARNGYYLNDSLQILFRLVFQGYGVGPQQPAIDFKDGERQGSQYNTFAIAPLKSHLFDPAKTPLLSKVKFRNRVLQRIIELLSLSAAQKGRGGRRGRISYAQLGINQLGAVYEGLLSYSGFFVKDKNGLYEVKKADDAYDELQNAYFVPESELENYSRDEKFIPQKDKQSGKTVSKLKHYEQGHFIYRLAGRNRQKSASYYTPEVLTRCVVKYALKELLKDKTADEILHLTVCEPAMGSGAFLNEAINQVAEAYLLKRQHELKQNLGHDEYAAELQKVKAYMAANNVYGVDLNPVAVELAEVSLWLNTIHQDSPVPWFAMQLVTGNSLIGARRQAFSSNLLEKNRKGETTWLNEVPVRYPLNPGLSPKLDEFETPKARPPRSVYHFLLPDNGMAAYNDKVVKQMADTPIKAIREWRGKFCKPFDEHHIAALERVSLHIDKLWQKHIADRRELRRITRDHWDLFGATLEGSNEAHTTQWKDKQFVEKILSRIDANSSAYRRLKLLMDYWCALWFWPIEKTDMLPTRDEYLLEIQSIAEGGMVDVTMIEDGQYLMDFGDAPVQQELDIYEQRGYVNLEKLCRDYPRLALVQHLAERYRFHHWELEFADLFAERGGFDLILGNPPWIKVEWSEGGILGDVNPRFVFDKLSASAMNKLREVALERHPNLRADYLAEFEEAEATQLFLCGYQNYPLLKGIQTNLFKCFLPVAWYVGSAHGASGFLHPEGCYDDPKGGSFRKSIYGRLRYHFQFQNGMNLFADVAHREKFSINAYGPVQEAVSFEQINNIFAVQVVDSCYQHSGHGLPGGIKDDDNNWNLAGHMRRIVCVDEDSLRLFAELYDADGTPALQARLPAVHTNTIISVLRKFADQPRRLGDLKGEYYSSEMWHETNAQKDDTIQRSTQFPTDATQWILSGPHFYVGNPTYKTPRRKCTEKGDYDPLDLSILPDDYLPRTNYVPACEPHEYLRRTPRVPWDADGNPTNKKEFQVPVTEFYRFEHRRQLSQSGERTFVPALLPPGAGHINPVVSTAFADTKVLMSFYPAAISLVYDFFLKSTGKSDLYGNNLLVFPLYDYNPELVQRSLVLTCINSAYSPLWGQFACRCVGWSKDDPRLDPDRFRNLPTEWTRDCALRTDFERRQALVEIDVLAAMALGLTVDELCAIYRIQFPVLRQNEADTWYDMNGRIVFTCSKGLPGVGLDRPTWNALTDAADLNTRTLKPGSDINPNYLADGVRVCGDGNHGSTQIDTDLEGKDVDRSLPRRSSPAKAGGSSILHTVTGDTIQDYRYAYGTFRKDGATYTCPCPEHPTPIEGPVERDIEYIGPFIRCDREADYRQAWEFFEPRMNTNGHE